MPYLPLKGIRVLEWARDRPGPMTGRKLADMGADVVKLLDLSRVESDKRTAGHALVGGTRLSPVLDRNKRSIYLDFEDEEDRRRIGELCDVADVIIEGSRPGAFSARTGVDFHDLRERRPEIVIASVSGFGQSGPLAGLAAQGTNLEALAGILPLERVDEHWQYAESANCTFTIELGFLHAVSGILAALYSARQTGQGAWVDASCWDGGVEVNRRQLSQALNHEDLQDVRELGPHASIYDAKDGRPVVLMMIMRKFWTRFCEALDRPDLLDRWNPTFSDDDSLRPILTEIIATRTAQEWNDFFLLNDIAASNTTTKSELLAHPHFEGRGMLVHSQDGAQQLIGDAIRWVDDDSRPGQAFRPVAEAGADTHDVLEQWLGAISPAD